MIAAVLSDIHGNLPALKAVLSYIEKINPDGIIVAGDLIGGPNLNETTSLLYHSGSFMILGNMDLDLLKYHDGVFSDDKRKSKQWSFMRWNSERVSLETLGILRGLHVQLDVSLADASPIRVVHGSPRDPYESIFPDKEPGVLETAISDTHQTVLICGHIHIQWQKRLGGKLIFNPGAVSAPLNGDTRAQFSILRFENGRWFVEPKAVPYDLDDLRKRYHESGLLEAGGPVSRAFLQTCETGRDVARPFYEFVLSLADKNELMPDEFIPDDIWLRADVEFPWEAYET